MDASSVHTSPSNQDQIKRVACTRCRAQKLKCIKSAQPDTSNKCDRCRRADTECNYAASRPVGRPRTSQSQRARRASRSPTSPPQSNTAAERPPQLHLDEEYLNTLLETAEPMLDVQDFDMFYGDFVPSPDQSDTSTGREPASTCANEPNALLTPPSSRGSFLFPTHSQSHAYTGSSSDEGLRPATGNNNHGAGCSPTPDPRRTMQHLADLGLSLYSQINQYQRACDDELVQGLAGDLLRSSTDYLDTLHVLEMTCQPADPGSGAAAPQLDMAGAFQLLIPYVRLVELHGMLFEAILRRLSGGGGGEVSAFPDVWVGGVCVNAGRGVCRARMLLQMSIHTLGEIEAVLALPDEARVCGSETWDGTHVGDGPGGRPGILPKAVSPRLLKMILDERDAGAADVQSMRDRIACIKRLLRCSSLRPSS